MSIHLFVSFTNEPRIPYAPGTKLCTDRQMDLNCMIKIMHTHKKYWKVIKNRMLSYMGHIKRY